MSKKYIEKEATINYLTLNMCWYDEEGGQVDDWDERKAIISDLLDGIPPADVKPVMKGEWVDKERHEHYPSGKPYTARYCGVCGKRDHNEDGDFCGYCGADMREEEDE